MRYVNWMTMRAKWLVPAGVVGCLALLAFDLVCFWALGLRPVMSTLLVETTVWSVLIGSLATFALKWAVSGESKSRFAVAMTLSVMVAISALHPWHNHYAIDAEAPAAKPILAGDPDAPRDVVVYHGGLLTGPDEAMW